VTDQTQTARAIVQTLRPRRPPALPNSRPLRPLAGAVKGLLNAGGTNHRGGEGGRRQRSTPTGLHSHVTKLDDLLNTSFILEVQQ
jgi:hypothetical protein